MTFLPIGDANPTRRRAVVTFALVAINIAVFVLLQPAQATTCSDLAFYYRWASVPVELVQLAPLQGADLQSALGSCATAVGSKSVLLSALTGLFLHGSWAHLLGNLVYLWVFGNNVEDRLGRLLYLAFYLGGGTIATYAFAFTNRGQLGPLIGASGAIAAVLGAYLVMFPRARIHTLVPFPLSLFVWLIPGRTRFFLIFAIADISAWIVLLGWFGLQVLATTSPVAAASGVAYAAHAGGFVAGMIGAVLLAGRWRSRTAHGLAY